MGVASFAGAEMTTFFGAAYEMLACEFGGGELTGGFNNVFCAAFTPVGSPWDPCSYKR